MAGKKKEILRRPTRQGIDIEIPLGVIEGAEAGATLCVVAGVHGTEYVGQETALRLFQTVDPQDVAGELTIVLVADTRAGFDLSLLGSRLDGQDLSTAFPGKENGSYTEALAQALTKEVASKADYLVELRGGGLHESVVGHVICPEMGDDSVDPTSGALAQVFDLPYIWVSKREPHLGHLLGIPFIVSELGGNGRREDELIDADFKGMLNVLKHLGMMEGQPEQTLEPTVLVGAHWLTAEADGVFYPTVSIDESVNKGQVLGELRDYFGEVLHEIVAPANGVVMKMNIPRGVKAGGFLIGLGAA